MSVNVKGYSHPTFRTLESEPESELDLFVISIPQTLADMGVKYRSP